MKKTVFLVGLMAMLMLNFAYAQKPSIMLSDKPGWHKIGEVKADFKMESQSISVMGKDAFTSILLKVTEAPVNIESLQVVFESGETQDVAVRSEIKSGGETRKIDLKGPGAQAIKQVKFVYKTLPNQKEDKAHVELYGYK